MSAYTKDDNDNNLCKKHTSRCDKDYRSVCPSKLSKTELEDLYYSLLENNLELKRTINAQNEKNRILSTKVQRMTALTKTYGGKDCCATGKAFANEQKAVIADLTKANEAMADRVRKLNTQLCTARQFLKQNPNARHCYKCYVNATMSVKNMSTTSMHNKASDANLKSVTSAIFPERAPPTTRTTGTVTPNNGVENDEKNEDEHVCNKDKCRSTLDDLKLRIKELEEELSQTQKDHYSRMSQLETQISQLRADAVRARSEQDVRARERDDMRVLERKLADNAELETQLSIEKKKVAELELKLKAAELSRQVALAIEEHLTAASRLEENQQRPSGVLRCSVCSNCPSEDISPRPLPTTSMSKRPTELTVPDDKMSKSDDSGYVDHRCESDSIDKGNNIINQELIKRIAEMQEQLDALQISSTQKFTNSGKESDDDKVFGKSNFFTENPEILVLKPSTELTEHLAHSLVVSRPELPEKYQNTPLKSSEYNNERQNKTDKRNVLNEYSKYLQKDTLNISINTLQKDTLDTTVEQDETNDNKLTERDSYSESGKKDESDEKLEQSNTTCRGNSQEELDTRRSSIVTLEPTNLKSDKRITQKIPGPLPSHNNPDTNKQPIHRKRASQNWKSIKKYGKKVNPAEERNKVLRDDKTARKECDDNTKIVNNDQEKKTIIHGKSGASKLQTQTEGNNRNEDEKELNSPHDKQEMKINNQKMTDSSIYNRENKTRETFEFAISTKVHNGNKDQLKIKDYDTRTYELELNTNMRRSSRIAEFDSVPKQPPIGTSTPKAEHKSTPRCHTYTVNSDNSRPTSPDNTDNEISGMTDLPTEKEASTPRDVLSPGEEKMTDTSTTPTYSFYHDVTLSEGEVPGEYTRRRLSKSIGEVQSMNCAKEDESIGEAKKCSADKMDVALQAISQELARCRALLKHQRPRNLTYGETRP